jgi:Phosphotransferase system cellobiose-specific component IIA
MEEMIMSIILNAGDARSKSLIAFKRAREYKFEEAKKLMKEASESLTLAHKAQTQMIQKEVSGEKQEVSLLMVHAQDHLMTALAIKDMVNEMIAFSEEIDERLKRKEEK